eukprot:110007-Amorphochlora_amoeboformis.AAC.1
MECVGMGYGLFGLRLVFGGSFGLFGFRYHGQPGLEGLDLLLVRAHGRSLGAHQVYLRVRFDLHSSENKFFFVMHLSMLSASS